MQLNDFEYWIDANIPPSLAQKLSNTFNIKAYSFHTLNFLQKDDLLVFNYAKEKKNVIIITKDEDFINWVILRSPPPLILWITIGNEKNSILLNKISNIFERAIRELLISKKSFIEIL